MPKVESEPLFASEEDKLSATSVAAKVAMTKLKNKKAFTPADTALSTFQCLNHIIVLLYLTKS